MCIVQIYNAQINEIFKYYNINVLKVFLKGVKFYKNNFSNSDMLDYK